MILRRYFNKRLLSHLFLLVLTLNISLIIPRTEWECDCNEHPERITCYCNCPKCIARRGGLLSYCHLKNNFEDHISPDYPVYKTDGCMCSLGHTVFHSPGDYPFLLSNEDFPKFPFPPAYWIKYESPLLILEDYIPPHDHPG